MFGRFGNDSVSDVEPVFTGGKAQLRFVAVLIRHAGEIVCIHIGRVANDDVVATFNIVKDIGLYGTDPL
eukprot:CAMPEP_0181277416 /NCGR_PEP_ID=MMETSP1097-20121128/11088_1 /TAXON_ID=35684 /ORGANISM="Pseudopedinella elastica, Strain CCMP716" /LENGTH=68 /DNA_ID=CAMNT_0023379241 /DNA_START=71 /DNA_END=273 /DNA_ORIENTATION=-